MPEILRPSSRTSFGHLISTRSGAPTAAATASATATAAASTQAGASAALARGPQHDRGVEVLEGRREEAASEATATGGLPLGDHGRARAPRPGAPARARRGWWSRSARASAASRREPARAQAGQRRARASGGPRRRASRGRRFSGAAQVRLHARRIRAHAPAPRSGRVAGPSAISSATSAAGAEWVSAPIEMRCTPVSAMRRTFSRRTPPETSSRTRSRRRSRHFADRVEAHVVEQQRVGAGLDGATARPPATRPRPGCAGGRGERRAPP